MAKTIFPNRKSRLTLYMPQLLTFFIMDHANTIPHLEFRRFVVIMFMFSVVQCRIGHDTFQNECSRVHEINEATIGDFGLFGATDNILSYGIR